MADGVRPLPYHSAVTDVLERENPRAFASLRPAPSSPSTELDQLLLRQAYRLDPTAHPDVHDAVRRAAEALGVTVPVEIYADEAGQGNNAELIFVPDRAVLLLTGNTLNLLDGAELCAMAGHEIAHYVLWSMDAGRFLAASRLLDAADGDARTPSEYLETARRFRLATELFADRGAMLACGSLTTAISGLLKVTTGLTKVDPDAYLRQAAEVDYGVPTSSTTHPETVLRAWALQQWNERGEASEAEVATALAPQLDLGSLDLLGQDRLAALTRSLVTALVHDDAVRGADSIALAQQFGVDATGTGPSPALPASSGEELPDLTGEELSAETRRYLAAVLFDFATVDPDASHDVLSAVLAAGRRAGLGSEVERMLSTELDLGDRALAKVVARAVEIATPPGTPGRARPGAIGPPETRGGAATPGTPDRRSADA